MSGDTRLLLSGTDHKIPGGIVPVRVSTEPVNSVCTGERLYSPAEIRFNFVVPDPQDPRTYRTQCADITINLSLIERSQYRSPGKENWTKESAIEVFMNELGNLVAVIIPRVPIPGTSDDLREWLSSEGMSVAGPKRNQIFGDADAALDDWPKGNASMTETFSAHVEDLAHGWFGKAERQVEWETDEELCTEKAAAEEARKPLSENKPELAKCYTFRVDWPY
jgi:hypothetical protein